MLLGSEGTQGIAVCRTTSRSVLVKPFMRLRVAYTGPFAGGRELDCRRRYILCALVSAFVWLFTIGVYYLICLYKQKHGVLHISCTLCPLLDCVFEHTNIKWKACLSGQPTDMQSCVFPSERPKTIRKGGAYEQKSDGIILCRNQI